MWCSSIGFNIVIMSRLRLSNKSQKGGFFWLVTGELSSNGLINKYKQFINVNLFKMDYVRKKQLISIPNDGTK